MERITITNFSYGGRRIKMKKEIHPEFKECVIKCACGASFNTLSNKDTHNVEVCNNCHPFYTDGATSKHKKAGAVEKFNQKYNIKQEQD